MNNETTNYTTQITGNPGSKVKKKWVTFRVMGSKIYNNFKKGEYRYCWNILTGDGANLFNKYFNKNTTKYTCPVCGYTGGYFRHVTSMTGNAWNSSCPECDSRSRHRALYLLYPELLKKYNHPSIIHFAPEVVFFSILKTENTDYKTTDYFVEQVNFPKEDIQKLSFANSSFDIAICNHVIEHVPDDEAAFFELSRILKAGGMAIITIPGDFSREKTIYYNHLRFNAHYRDYGKDVLKKIEKYFKKVDVIDLYTLQEKYKKNFALPKNEWCFVCSN